MLQRPLNVPFRTKCVSLACHSGVLNCRRSATRVPRVQSPWRPPGSVVHLDWWCRPGRSHPSSCVPCTCQRRSWAFSRVFQSCTLRIQALWWTRGGIFDGLVSLRALGAGLLCLLLLQRHCARRTCLLTEGTPARRFPNRQRTASHTASWCVRCCRSEDRSYLMLPHLRRLTLEVGLVGNGRYMPAAIAGH